MPDRVTRVAFRLTVRERRLRVELAGDTATYTLEAGDELEIVHEGNALTVRAGEPEERAITRPPQRPRPDQPPGREPSRR